MSTDPRAEILRTLLAANDPVDETEWLVTALTRFTGAELRELLFVAEEPGFFELMRAIYNLPEHSRSVFQHYLENNHGQSLAAEIKTTGRLALIYESLKDTRRKGELSHLKITPSELSTPQAEADFSIIREASAEIQNVSLEFSGAPDRLGRLSRFLEIRTLADRVFGGGEKAEVWLTRPNPSFSNQRPIDLLKDELGAAVVREALERIDHGIFA